MTCIIPPSFFRPYIPSRFLYPCAPFYVAFNLSRPSCIPRCLLLATTSFHRSLKSLPQGMSLSGPYVNAVLDPPPSYSTFLSLPIVTCLFFSAPIFSSFYHYSRTGYEEKTTMRRLFLPKHNVRFWPRPLKQTGCRAIRARKYKALRVRTMACSPFI